MTVDGILHKRPCSLALDDAVHKSLGGVQVTFGGNTPQFAGDETKTPIASTNEQQRASSSKQQASKQQVETQSKQHRTIALNQTINQPCFQTLLPAPYPVWEQEGPCPILLVPRCIRPRMHGRLSMRPDLLIPTLM